MFAAINMIDWSRYTTLFGAAADIPALFWKMVLGDPSVQYRAWDDLLQSVCHLGTVRDASLIVVPFLVEMLEAYNVYRKERVADLLAAISSGRAWAERVSEDVYAPIREQWPHFSNEQREHYLERRIQQAIDPHVPLLYPCLRKSFECLVSLAVAFTRYPRYATQSIDALNLAMMNEDNETTRMIIKLAVIYLSSDTINEKYKHYLSL
ncbi:MAG: hypothetical protein GFH27_549311n79 [Chloroflexi bacterium AL-W]|nr:hypothetical protein [Chloroflexi bacterium AL-N1]NOK68743.1 hypothetical protein [Chloroflexi bacterium AL-N10]NOK76229.1 hypothetical protein [Chloroflexi bacterium AL-N5]NOK84134.1 hypothetical protein [Chloroflexi bacterium AL-W]NOK91367.1 hypothetical protein [Chloroflexi bacterium AL-N15]